MSFTEKNLIPNAGLLPTAVLAQRVGLAELVDSGCIWRVMARTAGRRR